MSASNIVALTDTDVWRVNDMLSRALSEPIVWSSRTCRSPKAAASTTTTTSARRRIVRGDRRRGARSHSQVAVTVMSGKIMASREPQA